MIYFTQRSNMDQTLNSDRLNDIKIQNIESFDQYNFLHACVLLFNSYYQLYIARKFVQMEIFGVS